MEADALKLTTSGGSPEIGLALSAADWRCVARQVTDNSVRARGSEIIGHIIWRDRDANQIGSYPDEESRQLLSVGRSYQSRFAALLW